MKEILKYSQAYQKEHHPSSRLSDKKQEKGEFSLTGCTNEIDTLSSIIKWLTQDHLLKYIPVLDRKPSLSIGAILFRRVSLSAFPNLIPAQECTVVPLMFIAAMPVVAVTATESSSVILYLLRRWFIMARSTTDFPVPSWNGHSMSTEELKHDDQTHPLVL